MQEAVTRIANKIDGKEDNTGNGNDSRGSSGGSGGGDGTLGGVVDQMRGILNEFQDRVKQSRGELGPRELEYLEAVGVTLKSSLSKVSGVTMYPAAAEGALVGRRVVDLTGSTGPAVNLDKLNQRYEELISGTDVASGIASHAPVAVGNPLLGEAVLPDIGEAASAAPTGDGRLVDDRYTRQPPRSPTARDARRESGSFEVKIL